MSHSHNHNETSNIKVLIFALCITFSFMIVEFIGGIISNSLALISDAGHMINDSFSLALAAFAIYIGNKAANSSKTFGYKRSETLIGFLNGITLIIVAILILREGIERLFEPAGINDNQLIIIATIGLFVNILVALILFKSSKESLNIKGAFLHVLGDLLGSVGAIVSGLIIKFTGWVYADSLISIIIAGLIFYTSIKFINETLNILMEGVPSHININEVKEELIQINQVNDVHDLHIWALTQSKLLMTAHIVAKDTSSTKETIKEIQSLLHSKYSINHCTLQFENYECNAMCD